MSKQILALYFKPQSNNMDTILFAAILVISISLLPQTIQAEQLNLLARDKQDQLFSLRAAPKQAKLVNFFWIQCIPCAKELPELAHLEKEFPDILFLAIHAGGDDNGDTVSKDEVQKYLDKISSYPKNIYISNPRVAARNFRSVFPHTYILDKNNNILLKVSLFNEQTKQSIVKLLTELSQ